MPSAYLKIENTGVAAPESFTLLGASTKDQSNSRVIGKFGSGCNHSINLCLRNSLNPIVFCGQLKLDFGTRRERINDGISIKEFDRVFVKFSGKDRYGKSKTNTEELGYTLNYGSTDWSGVELALREFVSNAIDRAIEEGEYSTNIKWSDNKGLSYEQRKNPSKEILEELSSHMAEYRKTAKEWENVIIEVVNPNQVRAKSDTTRVFIPLNERVLNFKENLGKWFLHFSEPHLLTQTIFPKLARNFDQRKTAVIYRRGVRVREFQSSETPSLFDYNLEQLELDESRNVDDWRVQHFAARALADGPKSALVRLFESFTGGQKYWEHTFDSYGLEPKSFDADEIVKKRQKKWVESFESVMGEKSVLSTGSVSSRVVKQKGYNVIEVPEAFVSAAQKYGVRTPETVLSQDDLDGRNVIDIDSETQEVVNKVWEILVSLSLTKNKEIPPAYGFEYIMEGGTMVNGFYRDGAIYINRNSFGNSSRTYQIVLEELAHYVTGSTDLSRDFQDYAFLVGAQLIKKEN